MRRTEFPKTSRCSEMILADGVIYPHPGNFYIANRQINVQTGTIKIEGIFPNHGLYFASRHVRQSQRQPPTPYPTRCWFPRSPYSRPRDNTRSRWLALTTGCQCAGQARQDVRRSHGYCTGDSPGERIVIDGVQKVTDGMVVRPLMSAASHRGPVRNCQSRFQVQETRLGACRSSSSTGRSWRW